MSRSLACTLHLWLQGQVTQRAGSPRKLAGQLTGRALDRGAWLIKVQLGRGGLRVLARTGPRVTS